MESYSPETPEVPEKLNPWLSMWLRPRITVRYMLQQPPSSVFLPLLIAGISNSFLQADLLNLGDGRTLEEIMLLGFVGGTIGGILSGYLYSYVLSRMAGVVGGNADFRQTLVAFAWGHAPYLLWLLIWIIKLAMFGKALFISEVTVLEGNIKPVVYDLLDITEGIIRVWTLTTLLSAVAEVNQFSVWRSLGAFVLTLGVFFMVILIIAVILSLGFNAPVMPQR